MPLQLHQTTLPGLRIVETSRFADARGSFARLFCDRELDECVEGRRIVQINHSHTRQLGAVRGLHYQNPPHAEMKLVRCLRGKVWDVAVDLRRRSPTFLRWHAEELSQENGRMLLIPEGFAHGFQVLTPDSELLYLHTAHYAPEFEAGISIAEPRLAILWPLQPQDLSTRDANHPALDADFTGLDIS